MLNQVIYTRCSLHRDIRKQGQVTGGDGFSVYSMSQDTISELNSGDIEFLMNRLVLSNASNESAPQGLIRSYEYYCMPSGKHMLSRVDGRPLCREPRKNGMSHRTGTFINQTYIGDFPGYICEYIDNSLWNACQKPENYYYHDAPGESPDFLPKASISDKGYINCESIKDFVRDGRQEAVKAGVWFLIHEFSKPESERKVLLIRDTAENVEQWVAAISYAFSAEMAEEITFATNRTRLGTQTDSALFYYLGKAGMISNMKSPGQEQNRHPYCMIVGYHPQDGYCASLRQMPTSNYGIIDGVNKSAGFAIDDTVNMEYYSAVVKYSDDFQYFCHTFLPAVRMKEITQKLPVLYGGYRYLYASGNSGYWTYSKTLEALRILTEYPLPSEKGLVEHIFSKCMEIYTERFSEDENNGYILLKLLQRYAVFLNRESDIIGGLADGLSYKLLHLGNPHMNISQTWASINVPYMELFTGPVLTSVFNDVELKEYSKQFMSTDSETVATVADMFLTALDKDNIRYNNILESADKYDFICAAVIATLDSKENLIRIIKRIGSEMEIISYLLVNLFNSQHKTGITTLMDCIVEELGDRIACLCRIICQWKRYASIDCVEALLARSILCTHKYNEDTRQAFIESAQTLGINNSTGKLFFDTWFQFIKINDIGILCDAVMELPVDKGIRSSIFERIDHMVPYEIGATVSEEVYHGLRRFADRMNMASHTVALHDLMRDMKIVNAVGAVLNLIDRFAAVGVVADQLFMESEYLKRLTDMAVILCNGEIHINFIMMFVYHSEADLERFCQLYVRRAFEGIKKSSLTAQMIALTEALVMDYKNNPWASFNEISQAKRVLDHVLVKEISPYYKANIIEQVNKADCDPAVRQKLSGILEMVGRKAPKGKLGGIINNLLGRK